MKFLLSSQDIQNYKFIWNISKENYKKQRSSIFLMFLLVVFAAFFTTLLPYLLKIIIDYSAHEYNFLLNMMCAELAGDFHLGDSRQLTDKSLLPFDLVS